MDLRPVVKKLSSWGARPEDSEEVLLEKGLLVFGNLSAAFIQLFFFVLYWHLGLGTGIVAVLFFGLCFLVNTLLFRWHRHQRWFFRGALAIVLISVSAGQWLIGGHPPAQTLSIWSMLVPFVAATMTSSREALGWLAIYLGVTLPFVFIHAEPSARVTSIPPWMWQVFFALNMAGVSIFGFLIFFQIVLQRRQAMDASESLLLNILPAPIAQRLKSAPGTIAERFDSVTILFADIVGFTTLSARVPPEELVAMLDDIFSDFDALATEHGLEKIKTIGDAYMVVGGLPERRPDHADAVATMALGMLEVIRRHAARLGQPLDVRIGMHSGTVVAGVIGKRKFSYDLWGDAVNTASRMESHGVPGAIQVSDATHALLSTSRYALEPRGTIPVKGKGEMTTWLLKTSVTPRSAPHAPAGDAR